MERSCERPGPRPRRLVVQRHGKNYVRSARKADTFPAKLRGILESQVDRSRNVRGYGPRARRYVDCIRRGTRHGRTPDSAIDNANEFPPVVWGGPQATPVGRTKSS